MASLNTDAGTIALDVSEASPYHEAYAAEPSFIYPGMLLQRVIGAPPFSKKVSPHFVAGGLSEKMFAMENIYRGGDIHTPYSPDTKVMLRGLREGDTVLSFFNGPMPILYKLESGTLLASNGDGFLREWAGAGERALCVSLETVQQTDPATIVPPIFLRVRIL